MKLFDSAVGMTAQANADWARQSVNGVPFNVAVMAILLVLSGGCAGMVISDHKPVAILGFIPCAVAFGLFLISTFKRNTFFVGDRAPKENTSGPAGAAPSDPPEIPLGFTGKLRLDPKCERRFLNVPSRAERLESGELAFVSNIDASTRFYSIVTKSRVGLWLSLPNLQNATFENGTLLYGKTPMPALRVRYQETSGQKPKDVVTILSFANPSDRNVLHAFLSSRSKANEPLQSSPALV